MLHGYRHINIIILSNEYYIIYTYCKLHISVVRKQKVSINFKVVNYDILNTYVLNLNDGET